MRRIFLALLMIVLLGWPAVAVRADPGTEVGTGGVGSTILTYVGEVNQDGPSLTDFGYLTHVSGIDDAFLFSGSDPLSRSESTARFTFVAHETLTARSVHQNLFITRATGTIAIYFTETPLGASFDDSSSFQGGTKVAALTGTFQDMINVQAPNMGILTGSADVTEGLPAEFSLQGKRYMIGHEGLHLHLLYDGQGTRTDPTLPRSTIVYSGEGAVNAAGTATGSASSRAQNFAYAALGLGVMALVIGLVALASSRRRGA